MSFPRTATDNFKTLIREHVAEEVKFPHLKAVAGAQWALESGWGSSNLAKKYLNFAGMKWRPFLTLYNAEPVSVKAHDGEALYARFHTYRDFIRAYWRRLDELPAYKGWQDHTKTPRDFMMFVGPIWVGGSAAQGREYVRKVLQIHDERLAKIHKSLGDPE